jgi:ribose transport system substrate-binding protein
MISSSRTASRSTQALAISAAALLALAGCSKSPTGSSAAAPATSAAVTVAPSCLTSPSSTPDPATDPVGFNQANLTQLDSALLCALAGKDLSSVNIAMVVNIAADYWNAGETGFKAGCAALKLPSDNCTFFAPPTGSVTQQTSELDTLRSQGMTGYSISAIDPASAKGIIASDVANGLDVLAIDSPLPGTAAASLYLGTVNYDAGFAAGTEMKAALPQGGKVAVLVGSLVAANATQRIAGFEAAIKGSGISVVQTVNDNASASTAQTDAETILANNPGVTGLYGVYSYDGPALAQAVTSANKSATVKIVSDDSDTQTLAAVSSGVISGTIVQMPYEQGYTGALILTAEKVLGKSETMAIVKPYLNSDGSTLSSGVGVITKADLSQYKALETQLGIS